jgi:flagellar hook-length control protein FliK
MELRRAVEAADKKPKAAKTPSAKSAKKPAKKKSTKKTKAAQVPDRLRMVWGVFDNSNQQIAAFPYAQRAEAEKKVQDMAGKGKGPYFIQPVKEAILEEEVEETIAEGE